MTAAGPRHRTGLEAYPTGLLRAFPALASPRYRRFWFGMLWAPLAWQMYLVASGYMAFALSGSATTLGLVSREPWQNQRGLSWITSAIPRR